MATTTALQAIEPGQLASLSTSLPSIAELHQHLQWMSAFRPILLEYVQRHMDPRRHMYTFANNRYTPLNTQELDTMIEAGTRPALNQDGIHNLMSLYGCYPDEPSIVETRDEDHYTCRATLRLISLRSGLPMGAGTGSCSTRETKYAYRWVYERDVPKGMDKASLKSRERESRAGKTYKVYRLDNEDLADVEATVLQMAVKRAKSAAVKALPLVSEMFAAIGDPDEERHQEDEERQELLRPIGSWIRTLKGAARAKALLAVFQEPLRADDIAKLDVDRLAQALQVIEIATRQQVAWESPTLMQDLKQALATSAAQAKADLFGEPVDVVTGEVVTPEPQRPEPTPDRPTGTNGTWRDNVAALIAALPDALTPQTPADLVRQVEDACAQASRVVEAADTPTPAGEAMLETLKSLHDRLAGQLSLLQGDRT